MADSSAIHGLSVVDTTTNDAVHAQEDEENNIESKLVMKIQDEVPTGNGEISTNETFPYSEGILFFVDDSREAQVAEDTCVEEAEDKINLFDVFKEKQEAERENTTLHSSTLIITTEEHLDTTTCDDTLNSSVETVKNITLNVESSFEESKKTLTKPKAKSESYGYFWVSNIGRHIKATDLKKFFSPIGRVVTAKILTNGKSYFGYVSVDSSETASRCIKELNNAAFDGRKIILSKDRPDLREGKQTVKVDARRRRSEMLDLKQPEVKEYKVVADEKEEQKRSKAAAEEDLKTSNTIADLKNKLEKFKIEVGRYKFKIEEYQRRHEGMRKKCSSLEKELKEAQFKMRTDRRKLNQDREQFEKNKKLDQIRLEADKAVVNKELDEVKKLREHLKTKIDELKAQSNKNVKNRGIARSPPPIVRTRSPRRRSPVLRPVTAYRSDDRMEKKRKRDEPPLGRTPPPPPKLSNGMGKKRGEVPRRQYFEDVQKIAPTLDHGHGYEYRHKSSFAPTQEVSRTPWQAPYPKDPRRMTVTSSSTQSYAPDPRYGGGYQFAPSNLAVPARSYYPEYGKPYVHY